MTNVESELERAERHVREGLERVHRQSEILQQLKADHHNTKTAEALLHTLEGLQQEFESNLAELRKAHHRCS